MDENSSFQQFIEVLEKAYEITLQRKNIIVNNYNIAKDILSPWTEIKKNYFGVATDESSCTYFGESVSELEVMEDAEQSLVEDIEKIVEKAQSIRLGTQKDSNIGNVTKCDTRNSDSKPKPSVTFVTKSQKLSPYTSQKMVREIPRKKSDRSVTGQSSTGYKSLTTSKSTSSVNRKSTGSPYSVSVYNTSSKSQHKIPSVDSKSSKRSSEKHSSSCQSTNSSFLKTKSKAKLSEIIDEIGIPHDLLKVLKMYYKYVKEANSKTECDLTRSTRAKNAFLKKLNEMNNETWQNEKTLNSTIDKFERYINGCHKNSNKNHIDGPPLCVSYSNLTELETCQDFSNSIQKLQIWNEIFDIINNVILPTYIESENISGDRRLAVYQFLKSIEHLYKNSRYYTIPVSVPDEN